MLNILSMDEQCPIRAGMSFSGVFGRKFLEVGQGLRVGGGWLAPVKVRKIFRTRYALARYYGSDKAVSIDSIVEHRSSSTNAQCLLEDSGEMPALFLGDDPGVLCAVVVDIEDAAEDPSMQSYQLYLSGITGHYGEADKVVAGTF